MGVSPGAAGTWACLPGGDAAWAYRVCLQAPRVKESAVVHTKGVRTILHSDLNNFYASVECLRRPELRALPVAVVGDKEARHGIVLAKNERAKVAGVTTGEVTWQARKKCANLVEITADFPAYLRFSEAVADIYRRYTDQVEAYGIDECWLDVTKSRALFGSGAEIAERIRREVREEIGVTVSVGVSWNKIFAKLASEIRKPDAVTLITPENFRETAWSRPVSDLLYVGKATAGKLALLNIFTVGDLARADPDLLEQKLHKWGIYLWRFANGLDESPVQKVGASRNIRSIGNSLTAPQDMASPEALLPLCVLLCESVVARMRGCGLFKAAGLGVTVTDSRLAAFRRQRRIRPTGRTEDFAAAAMELAEEVFSWERPARALGVWAFDFVRDYDQLDFLSPRAERLAGLDRTVDALRKKYGPHIVKRAVILKDPRLAKVDVKGEHVIHPYGFFHRD